jgi:hypothetical protein
MPQFVLLVCIACIDEGVTYYLLSSLQEIIIALFTRFLVQRLDAAIELARYVIG